MLASTLVKLLLNDLKLNMGGGLNGFEVSVSHFNFSAIRVRQVDDEGFHFHRRLRIDLKL